MMVFMRHETRKDFETIGEAAQRLLAGLEARIAKEKAPGRLKGRDKLSGTADRCSRKPEAQPPHDAGENSRTKDRAGAPRVSECRQPQPIGQEGARPSSGCLPVRTHIAANDDHAATLAFARSLAQREQRADVNFTLQPD